LSAIEYYVALHYETVLLPQRRIEMSQVDESREESEARLFFETALQLRVERVPAAATETADYIVDGEEPGYVVEVKARLGDEKEREALRERGHTVKEEPWTFHPWAVDAAHKAT
jgi:hypothetical protein